jgi:hypothetical protein
LTATPLIQLPFSDNFDKGIDPRWQQTVGTWITSDGKLIPVNNNGLNLISLDSLDWTNYKVKVNIHIPSIGSAAQKDVFVAVRVSGSNSNMIVYCFPGFGSDAWSIYGDGCKKIAGDGVVVYHTDTSLELQVIGNEFIAFIDGRETQRITYPGYEKGGITLGSECYVGCASFDNFSVEALP